MTEPRHNPALAAYISGWQNFVAQISKSEPDLSVSGQAMQDLEQALENYQKWCQRLQTTNADYQQIWNSPVASLHDCGGSGHAIIVIPSLINSHQILDLLPEISFISHLKQNGFHVHLLKWGAVTSGCSHRTTDYVQAIAQASAIIGDEIHAIGYCVGGTLLNIAATQMPNLRSQVLLGAPWNFHHDQGQMGIWAKELTNHNHLETFFDQIYALYGLMPSTMIDYFFAGLNPLQFVQKFRYASAPSPRFDALENWLTNGLDLSYPFSRELVLDWMRDNRLASSNIQHDAPSLIIHGQRDHIAPPASCLPIATTMKSHKIIAHPSGHVGLMVGKKAPKKLWPEIINYLNGNVAQ